MWEIRRKKEGKNLRFLFYDKVKSGAKYRGKNQKVNIGNNMIKFQGLWDTEIKIDNR